jgi:hypothetical protein
MARFDVVLRPGSGTDVYLRPNRVATDVYLFPATGNAADVYLRPGSLRPYPEGAAGGESFPTQFFGLRTYDNGAVQDLCLVATADAPGSMGGQLRISKNGTVYAVYLVETSDGNASTVRLRTSSGTKAIRLKT